MSTRSDIIVHRADGKWARIYCHSDGYLEHNGRILQGHYTTQEKAEALAALGDISVLGEEIGEEHPFDGPSYSDIKAREEFDAKFGKMVRAYGRDRHETGTEASVSDALKHALGADELNLKEYTYVWDNGAWTVQRGFSKPVPLTDALKEDAI